MLLKVSYSTTYSYDTRVDYALQQVRMTPKSGHGQAVIDWQMNLEGARQELEYTDEHHNRVSLISVDAGNRQYGITCEGRVEVTNHHGIIGTHQGYAPLWLFMRPTPLTIAGQNIKSLVGKLGDDFESDARKFHSLLNLIAEKVTYQPGETSISTTAEQALKSGYGVCQDHAHVFIAAARYLGYPARYVSGFLMMNDRIDQDASHAWAEVHLSDLGWVGFDVSNGISPDERYIRVATGLDYTEASPVRGLRFGKGNESMIVSLQVQQ